MRSLGAMIALLCAQGYHPAGPKIEVELSGRRSFVITTDTNDSPKTTKWILNLVKRHFYDGQRFHRVESWLVQWGDPQSKTFPPGDSRLGNKGSGRALPFEDSNVSFVKGIVGVVSKRSRVGGDSQLFVLTKDETQYNHTYTVLGRVTRGLDVVERIRQGDRILRMFVVR